ncbi:hypothetical protein BDR04DRAFT_1162791 [Suillus decipiens]|nr:hypothetical protein BDR04DRAFT_1162791 [Suillus decipiens]
MRLGATFGVVTELRLCGLWPTILATCHAPSLVFQPLEISRVFMSRVWNLYGDSVDEAGGDLERGLITLYAYGIVLDLGAGHTDTLSTTSIIRGL